MVEPVAHLIYNPYAGRISSAGSIEKAARVLESTGWQIALKESESGDHTVELARQAAQSGVDVLIIAGGDGSIERAVTGLVGSETALGVLPTGTANVWAQELRIPIPGLTHNRTALEDAAQLLTAGRIREVDLGMCGERPFLLWAGVGLDAEIVHGVEPRPKWQKHLGASYYAATAVAKASRYKGLELCVRVNGEEISGRFILSVLSNIRLYAGGKANLSPQAILDDGQMELWLFHGESINDLIWHVRDVLTGNQFDSDHIRLITTNRVELEASEALYVQLDGEPYEVGSQVRLDVLKKGLKILVPPTTPEALFSSAK